jgi:nucleotidyltransferase/DNA polymerase involved in DNA repair
VFVPPRFDIYRAVSRQIHATQPLLSADRTASLDEAYLDVTQDLRSLQTASATAKEICARILQRLVSPRRPASPTTSSLPSWRPANASRMVNSSLRPRWGRTSSRRCRSPGSTG